MARSTIFSDLSYGAISRLKLIINEGSDVLTYAFYENCQLLQSFCILHVVRKRNYCDSVLHFTRELYINLFNLCLNKIFSNGMIWY